MMRKDSTDKLACLVVDDNYEIFVLIEAALGDTYVCEYAPDAFAAHQLFLTRHFDIMLCDIRMPHMDGFDLVEELKKKMISIPIIFISGAVNPDNVKRAFQLGAANIIAKPLSLQELRDKIKLALALRQRWIEQSYGSDQEMGYVYNLLKTYYYDTQKILYQIQLYHIPIAVVKDELDKKQRLGKCFLDDPESIRFLARAA
jgi:DNA-binding response OmpR family regulator